MGASQRRKGATWEREVAKRFCEVIPGAKRGLGQCRNAGEVADVDVPGYWVECKRGKRTNPKAALKQAIEASGDTPLRMPVAVCKDDYEEPTATVRLDDFLELVMMANAAAKQVYGGDK